MAWEGTPWLGSLTGIGLLYKARDVGGGAQPLSKQSAISLLLYTVKKSARLKNKFQVKRENPVTCYLNVSGSPCQGAARAKLIANLPSSSPSPIM